MVVVARAGCKELAQSSSCDNTHVVTAERVVFNIRGNGYRLVVSVDFEKSIVWIKWLGTYRDYDRIDVTKVEHEK